MAKFDMTDKVDRDLRRCRTRAFVARLFAAQPVHPSNGAVWDYIADSWEHLAVIKENEMRAHAHNPAERGAAG
jgi:hypothetical protein